MLSTDDHLAAVAAPTLFLWGDEDPNGGEAVARAFAARVPNGELQMVAGAGHAPWLDQLDECAAATPEFLGT